MTKFFLISVAILMLMMICSLIASIHDVRKHKSLSEEDRAALHGDRRTASPPKLFGWMHISSGKWRRNRIKRKQQYK